MKTTIIIAIMAIASLTSCGPTEEERANILIEQCHSLMQHPAFKAYYSEPYRQGHENAIKACGMNVLLLESEHDNLLDRLAEAQAEIAIQKAIEEAGL